MNYLMNYLIGLGIAVVIVGLIFIYAYRKGKKAERAKVEKQESEFKTEVLNNAKKAQQEFDKIKQMSRSKLNEEANKSAFCKKD